MIQHGRMILPVIGIVDGNRNQASIAALGTGHQNPSRFLGIAGFHAHRAVIAPEKLIVIGIGSPAQSDGLGGHNGVKGIVFHGLRRENGKIPGCCMVFLVIQAVGIGKMGARHAKGFCAAVHERHKLFHAPRTVDGQRHRRIVAGVEH